MKKNVTASKTMRDLKYKICIFGDGGVGKTTLVNRYLTGLFKDNSDITIGADFYVKRIAIDGIKITLQIWDFAGESRFRFILPSYLIGSNGCIFMYDITRYSSVRNVKDWMSVFKKGTQQRNEEIPIIMVGGKLDLQFKRVVSKEAALEVLKEQNFLDYTECSAKTGENVEAIFLKIARIVMVRDGLIKD